MRPQMVLSRSFEGKKTQQAAQRTGANGSLSFFCSLSTCFRPNFGQRLRLNGEGHQEAAVGAQAGGGRQARCRIEQQEGQAGKGQREEGRCGLHLRGRHAASRAALGGRRRQGRHRYQGARPPHVRVVPTTAGHPLGRCHGRGQRRLSGARPP